MFLKKILLSILMIPTISLAKPESVQVNRAWDKCLANIKNICGDIPLPKDLIIPLTKEQREALICRMKELVKCNKKYLVKEND